MPEISAVPAFRDNYIWLIGNNDNRVAIVDPGDAVPVLEAVAERQLEPAAILTTHHHADHVGGVNQLLEHYHIPVYGPARESIPGRTDALKEGDTITLDSLGVSFDILDVPGHTAGHIAYYGEGCLFIGDTLFMSGCGRLFEGTAAQMHDSLEKVASLPDETQIYCAHEYTLANLRFAHAVEPENKAIEERTRASQALREQNRPTVPGSLAQEKATNPFLRVREHAVVQAAEARAGHALKDDVEVFATLRAWKDSF
ncbi:MAG: hydroxyacylglutathione hydrolase [Gammaproteobacteria bacterium]